NQDKNNIDVLLIRSIRMVVGARQADLSVRETTDLGFSCTTISGRSEETGQTEQESETTVPTDTPIEDNGKLE
uniref:Uncharacterized protein n=1 Tax=Takifugu rubripes TaxID=31033 RepID=A0A674MQU3_TAKRU